MAVNTNIWRHWAAFSFEPEDLPFATLYREIDENASGEPHPGPVVGLGSVDGSPITEADVLVAFTRQLAGHASLFQPGRTYFFESLDSH